MKVKEAIKTLDDFQCDIDYAAEFRGPLSFAIDEAKDALEKQVPKKPINIERFLRKISSAECPHCRSSFPDIGGINEAYGECEQYEYCPDCGQKLDWSD